MTAGRKLAAAALLLLAVFCWRMGDGSARELAHYAGLSTVRLSDPLTAGDYPAMERLESEAARPLAFALWSEHGGETVEARDLARSAAASVLTLRGSSRLVLPGSVTLEPSDLRGCLLDHETAMRLFGGVNVTGSILRWRGGGYEIRGVIDLPAPTMVVNLPGDSEMPLGLLTVASDNAAELLARHGLSARLVVRGLFFTRLAAVMAALPVFAAAVLLFAALLRQWRRSREYPLRGFVAALGAWALAAVALLALLRVVPPEFIPGRWSDFPAWAELFRGWRRGLLELFASEKPRNELRMTAEALRASWGLAACAPLLLCDSIIRKAKQ